MRAEPPEGESTWLMKQPEEIQASDGAVAFLLNLIATETSQRTLEVAGDRKTEFGFDRPAIVNVILENGEEHVLVLGLANFDQSAFYALIDTPPTSETLPGKRTSNRPHMLAANRVRITTNVTMKIGC